MSLLTKIRIETSPGQTNRLLCLGEGSISFFAQELLDYADGLETTNPYFNGDMKSDLVKIISDYYGFRADLPGPAQDYKNPGYQLLCKINGQITQKNGEINPEKLHEIVRKLAKEGEGAI